MWFSIVTLLLLADGAYVGNGNSTAHGNTLSSNANAVLDYTVSAVSEPGHCRFVIHPNAPWSLKPTTPFEALLQATEMVTLGKQALSEKDYLDPKASDKTLLVAYTAATAAMETHVRAALNFFLCTDEVCQRFKHTADCKVVLAQAAKP